MAYERTGEQPSASGRFADYRRNELNEKLRKHDLFTWSGLGMFTTGAVIGLSNTSVAIQGADIVFSLVGLPLLATVVLGGVGGVLAARGLIGEAGNLAKGFMPQYRRSKAA